MTSLMMAWLQHDEDTRTQRTNDLDINVVSASQVIHWSGRNNLCSIFYC